MKPFGKIIHTHTHTRLSTLLIIGLASAAASLAGLLFTDSSPGYAGILSGTFQVSGSGDARYVINLSTPPGTAAMEPSLSIVYASAAGEGLLGNGWRLNGLSVINRVAATEAQDGFVGALNFDEDDRFALDGSRLLNTLGAYGADGSTYHTEMESWTRVIAHGDTCGSGPCWFEVTDRTGIVKEYGRTTDSRVYSTNGKGVRVWALNKITDLNGNYLTVSYQQETQNGSYSPLSIDYSGNTHTGYTPMRHVYFDYQDRPDVVTLASGGGIIKNTKLLAAIRTEVQGKPVLSYRFGYTQSTSTSRSLLSQVQECAANGACLPALSLQWSATEPGLIDSAQQLSVQMDQGQLIPLDINGDGLMDLANIKKLRTTDNFPTIIEAWLSNGQTYYRSGSISFSNSAGGNFYAADFNADGRLDIIKCLTTGKLQTQVFLSTGESYRASAVYNGPSGIYYGTAAEVNFSIGDINGDSKADLIYGVVKVFNDSSQVQLTNFVGNDSLFSPLATQSFHIPTLTGGKLYSGDFNADSKTDVAYVTTQLNSANALQSALLINNRQNQYTLGTLQSFPFYKGSSGQLILGDVNGDGNTDMVYSYLKDSLYLTTLLSNGASLFLSQKNGLPYPGQGWIMPEDINGDGLTDLAYINASNTSQFQFYVYPSDGTGYRQQITFTEPTTSASYNPMPMDINGDALTDLLYVKSVGGNTPQYQFSRFMASGPYPDLLLGIDNGVGGQIAIKYKPLTDTTVYKKTVDDTLIYLRSQLSTYSANSVINNTSGATYLLGTTSKTSTSGTYIPAVPVQFPKYCVASYSKSGGTGTRYGFSLFYAGAKVAHNGRGWLGFAQKTLIDSNLQVKAKSYFHQAFPLTGQIAVSQVTDLQNRLYRRYGLGFEVLDSTYAATGVQTAQALRTSIRTAYYDQGVYAYTTGQDFRYDTYGNTILNINYGDMATPKTCVYSLSQYVNDPINWRLGYLRQQLMSSDSLGTDTLYLKVNQYDPTTYQLSQRQYWDDSNQSYVDTSFRYDPYGNVTMAILPNGDSTFIAYEEVYHSFVSEAISPNNQWGKRLKTYYRYEPYFGLLTTSINANGDSTVNVFDALGRDSLTYTPQPDGKMLLTAKTLYLASPSSGVGYQAQHAIRLDWEGKKWDAVLSEYDGFNQVIRVSNSGQNARPVYTDIRYNSRNKIIAKSIPYYQGDQPYWHTIQYDPAQRVTQVTGPKGYTDSVRVQIAYAGKSITVTEAVGTPNQARSTVIYDLYNSQRCYTHLVNKNGDTTRISYDLMANMVLFQDPQNITTSNTYNTLGNTVKTVDASMGTFWYSHDYAHSYSQVINSLQDTTKLWFDGMNRLILQEFEDGTAFSLQYDLPQNKGSQGALSKVYWNANSYYSYHYDRNGQTAEVQTSYEGMLFREGSLYNADGSPAQSILPDSSLIAYTYSSQSLLENIRMMDTRSGSKAFKTYASFTEFDASDNILQAEYGNQTQTNFTYFPAGRINTQQVSNQEGDFIDDSYHWNYTGMLDSIIDGSQEGTLSQFFTYDPAQRLLSARGLYGSQQYGYDASGNLKLKDSIRYTYSHFRVSSGVLGQDTVFRAKYDVLGNMTEKLQLGPGDTSLFQYRYNAQNLLSLVIKNADTLYQFSYDYDGRRVAKIDHQADILSVYVSENYEITYYPDSILTTKYIHGPSGLVASVTHADTPTPTTARIVGGMPTTGTLYFHQNNINSTLYVTDEQGQPVSRMVYTPYGSVYQQSAGGADNFRYKFSGKELDEADGLYYFNARYYDPAIGRFTTADTELGGSAFKADVLNRYAYTLNNPVLYSDPSGHGVGEAIMDVAVIGVTLAAEVALDVVTAGAAIPEELAVDAGIVGAEVTADVTADALVDAGIDATTDALADLGTESLDDTFFDILGEGSEESSTGDATSRLEFSDTQESCMCLTAGTQVQTTSGTKAIASIGIGDTILAYHEHERRTGPYRVRMLYERSTDTLLRIYVAGDLLETTPNHPFWQATQWVPAGQLQTGDLLSRADGSQVKIDRIERLTGTFRVYNIEVADAHTYYASAGGILVHNGVSLCRPVTRGLRKKTGKRFRDIDTDNIIGGKRASRPPVRFGHGISRYGDIYPGRSYRRYVDFGSRVQRQVRIEFTGNLNRDFKLADQKAGFKSSYRKTSRTTWHHHTDVTPGADGKYYGTMQLVDQETHQAYPHYGGEAIYRSLVGSGYGR